MSDECRVKLCHAIYTLYYQCSNGIASIAIRLPNLSFAVQMPYKLKRKRRCSNLQRRFSEV